MQKRGQRSQCLEGIALPVMPIGNGVAHGNRALLRHDYALPHHLVRFLQRHCQHKRRVHADHVYLSTLHQRGNLRAFLRLPPLIPRANLVVSIIIHHICVLRPQIAQRQTLRFKKNHAAIPSFVKIPWKRVYFRTANKPFELSHGSEREQTEVCLLLDLFLKTDYSLF